MGVKRLTLQAQAGGDAEGRIAVKDGLFKGLSLAELGVRMVWHPVTRMHCMHDDVGLGNRSGTGRTGFADLEVFKKFRFFFHGNFLSLPAFMRGGKPDHLGHGMPSNTAADAAVFIASVPGTLAPYG